jgi:NTE family protein
MNRMCTRHALGTVLALAILAGGVTARAQSPAGEDPAAPEETRAEAPPAPAPRPRIGLVLGGGGAKGAAHVGVIRVLDELRIPIDCVVGTSMGALVGGTYASGMSAEEIEAAVRAISWSGAIAFEGKREKVPMRRKLAGVTYSNSLEFGLKNGRITAPAGFINTQNIEQTIQALVSRSRGVTDFDRLPIQFRAIATDMQSGEMVVLANGDLAQAMRASMSVPGVFAPVNIDGRILGDGGLSRNLPVDIARETCADVVIAVAVPNPVPTPEELQSPITMMSRTLDVLIGANEKAQLATLGPGDVKMIIETGDIGTASFEKVGEAIPLGRETALAQRAELERYSLPRDEYLAWRRSVTRERQGAVTLAGVTIQGLERVNPAYVLDKLGLESGDVVDEATIARKVNDVFALSDFESVHYVLTGDPGNPVLDLRLREKSWGPHIVRFDLGLYMGTGGNTAFTVGGDYLRTWINDRGGELHGTLRVGRTSGLEASLYQPIDTSQTWFVEPGVVAQRSLEDLYVDGDAAARYEFAQLHGFLDFGRVYGTRSEIRAGIRAGTQWARREIALAGLPEIDGEGYGGVALGYNYDSRDRDMLANRGVIARVNYFRGEEALGSAGEYERVEGMAGLAVPFGDDMLYLRASGGSSLATELPVYDLFTLGGPVSMPGLAIGELRGTSYWSGQAAYLRKFADISPLFGHSLYLGATFTAADMSGRIDGARKLPIYSGALVLGGRTPLGPVNLSLALTSESAWQFVFGLGRPIEERTITDPAW